MRQIQASAAEAELVFQIIKKSSDSKKFLDFNSP